MFNFKSHSFELGCVVGVQNFFSLSQEGDLYCDGIKIDEIPIKRKKISLWLVSNKLIVDDKYGELRIYDCTTRECIFKNDTADVELYIGGSVSLYAENIISVLKVNGVTEKDSLLNLDDCKIIDADFEFKIYHQDLLFSKFSVGDEIEAIRAYDKTSKVVAWQYTDLHKYGSLPLREKKVESVHEIFGVAKGLLWVHLTSDRIVGLSPETGECIKSIGFDDVDNSDFKSHPEEFKHIVTNWGYMFIPEESKIVSLPRGRYTEIDLAAVVPVRKCFNTEKKFLDVNIACSGRMIAHGNMIYFCDVMSTKVGAFDRDKKELVWHDDLKNYHESAGMPAKIMATNTHLYFHDSNNNLFVFSRV